MTVLWVSLDVGKGVSSEFIGGAMGLLMTLGCRRLIWSMHQMCYSIGFRHTSYAALSMLVFYCLGGFVQLHSCCKCIEHSGVGELQGFGVLGIGSYMG